MSSTQTDSKDEPHHQEHQNTKRRARSIFNLEDQFEFYGQYHSNPVNVYIHIICVPLIFFTSLILAHNTRLFQLTDISKLKFGKISLPDQLLATGILGKESTNYDLNLATITTLGYALYFIALEPLAGLLYSPILILMGHWSNVLLQPNLNSQASPSNANLYKITFGIWVFSWVLQFLGHGKFEKRAPALIDNLFQSIVLAVFFVWMEVLFKLGYRPSLKQKLDHKINNALSKYRASKANPQSSSVNDKAN
ncbi:hypothetical protein O181_079088 [Austropuccinia psidii MF-1]|uniref:Uncharacterized protein n=1 Tax=Austropuccinia psidii MF-1 TaxID=1389203 RepID=A0A9Q3FG15_9BASI|nr:hypothetical protein [Austropuccinia psidii MF-1]